MECTLAPQRNNEGMPLPGIHATTTLLDNISVDNTYRSQTTGGTPRGNLSNSPGVTPLPPSNNDTTSTTENATYTGLLPPTLPLAGEQVIGAQKKKYHAKMKARQIKQLASQKLKSLWTTHTGTLFIPTPKTHTFPDKNTYRNSKCPSNLALNHPAAPILAEWSKFGCSTMTGQAWTRKQIKAAIKRGPHQSSLSDKALKHFATEAKDKVALKQARIVSWDSIKENLPKELKILPIAAIPHKLKAFRSILDLSFFGSRTAPPFRLLTTLSSRHAQTEQ
jgi:hypothetical protein